jgi:hypothetical protein
MGIDAAGIELRTPGTAIEPGIDSARAFWWRIFQR